MRKNQLSPGQLAGTLLLAALAGCAGQQKPKTTEDVVWPPPPETPRIRWVRDFQGEQDLGASALRSFGRAFMPLEAGTTVGQPTGLALSPDEKTLYISSNAMGRVLAVDLVKGGFRRFATEGETIPVNPFGVATDANGNVYMTDHVRGRVVVFGPDNKFLRQFGEAKVERATGIAIDRRRQLVYVTAGAGSVSQHHRVEVFSLKGEHLRTIGTRGHSAGEFNFPANLAMSKDGELYVADMLNFRIQVFDPEGQLVGMWGQLGAGMPGTFDKLKSVGLDAFGNVYAVDSGQAFVQIFNPNHQPLMAFGGKGVDPGFMALPTAIAITSDNTIFVADFAFNVVHQYELINTTAADSYIPSDAKRPASSEAKPGATPPATPAKAPAPAAGEAPAGTVKGPPPPPPPPAPVTPGAPGQKPQGG
jgi:sugar lactone lactonase YvrE